jgi:hypothetical protein
MKTLTIMLGVFLGCSAAWADTIHLRNGGTLEGVILKKSEDGVVVLLKYATVTIGSFEIESVEQPAQAPVDARARLQTWERCFHAIVAHPWSNDLARIPARVIENGPCRNVPYVLHASGDYQFALYGDPDAPACLELGLSGTLLVDSTARKECIDLMASFLRKAGDQETLRALSLRGGKKESDGLNFEISQDPDSRGRETWWVSVSDPAALDQARVTDKQLESLVSAEPAQTPRNPTLVDSSSTGKGEKQDTITPFGTEPDSHNNNRRSSGRYYGGIPRMWGNQVRWSGGHVTGGGKATHK